MISNIPVVTIKICDKNLLESLFAPKKVIKILEKYLN
jgi:hypothetical protein